MSFNLCLVAVFLAALAAVLAGVPLVCAAAERHGLVDRPGARKVHARPTPTSGGVAFYFALAVGLLVFYVARPTGFSLPGAASVLNLGPEPGLHYLVRMFSYLLVALVVLAGAGLYDDAFNLRARPKLALQVLAATLVYLGGFRITQITGLASDVLPLPGVVSYLVTVLWIVGLTNAVNFMDGLDGLAAGVCAVAAASLLVISLAGGDDVASLLYAIILAASLGFLGYNFHPARIFMGDCGSMFLGFMLAVAAIVGTSKGTTFLALLLPVGLPVFDVFSAVFRRKSAGRSMLRADRNHLHHRLLDLGFSYRTVVWVFYGLSLFLGLSAIIAAQLHPRFTLILIFNFVIATVLASYVLEFIESKVR